MKELILATGNQGKLRELQALLPDYRCFSQAELGISPAEENGLSFVENALIKARQASLIGQKPALADDSGLVVHALNGEPGIYSARYADPHDDQANMVKLLAKLAKEPQAARQAYFYCALVFIRHAKDPTPLISTAQLKGRIHHSQEGDGGFGYDPIFYVDEFNCTLAQLPLEVKNKLSHRAKALRQLSLDLKNE